MIRGILVDVLQEIRQLKNSPRDAEVPFFVRYPNIKFPIGTVDEIDRFEEELQYQENFNDAENKLLTIPTLPTIFRRYIKKSTLKYFIDFR